MAPKREGFVSSSTQPPGWLPDPTGRHQYRYWDGRNWTANVSDNGVVSNDPLQAPTPPTQVYTPSPGPTAPSAPQAPGAYPPAGGVPPYQAAQTPSQPYVAPTTTKKKGLNPFVLIIPAVIIVVAVVAFFTLAGGGGGDGTGKFAKKITNQTQLDRFKVKLKKGDLLRINAAPEKKLDIQIALVPPEGVFTGEESILSERFSDQLPSDFNFSDQLDSVLASDETDFFSDIGNKDKLVALKVDDGTEGVAEKKLMLAPVDGTYLFLVRAFGGQTGSYTMTFTRTERAKLVKNDALLSEAFDSAEFSEFFTSDLFSDFNTDSVGQSDSSFSDFSNFTDFTDFTTDFNTDVLNSKSG